MLQYTVRRLGLVILSLVGVSMLLYGLMHLAPGGPEAVLLGEDINPHAAAQIRIALGLHRPIYVQYYYWARNMITGDMGLSYRTGYPVANLIARTLPNTIILGFSALAFSISVSVVIGVMAAIRQYSLFDHGATIFSFTWISMPNFWFGLLCMMYFGYMLGWFPISGTRTIGLTPGTLNYYLDRAHHLVLPVIVLGMARLASLVRYTRSSMLDIMHSDFIRTARAKGLSERTVIYKHALRNALVTVVTVVGLSLRFLVSGSVIVESVFAYNGIGRSAVHAVFERDYPLIMGINMMIAVVVLLANLITDLAYALVDPRITYK